MSNIYTETGGLRSGSSHRGGFNTSWPFVVLKATPEEIEIIIRGFISSGEAITLRRESIEKIRRVKGLFSTGVHIEHHEEREAPYILFWTFKYKALKQALVDLGYDVIDK
jgi:hypothetical protein